MVGDMCGGGTPGPISNPAVKPASADGSIRATVCESRSLPTATFPPPVFFYWLAFPHANYIRSQTPKVRKAMNLHTLFAIASQRDPKKEYKREGYDLFVQTLQSIKASVVDKLFRVQRLTEREVAEAEAQRRRQVEARQRAIQASHPAGGPQGQAEQGQQALPLH